jgi:hypothetical protein
MFLFSFLLAKLSVYTSHTRGSSHSYQLSAWMLTAMPDSALHFLDKARAGCSVGVQTLMFVLQQTTLSSHSRYDIISMTTSPQLSLCHFHPSISPFRFRLSPFSALELHSLWSDTTESAIQQLDDFVSCTEDGLVILMHVFSHLSWFSSFLYFHPFLYVMAVYALYHRE